MGTLKKILLIISFSVINNPGAWSQDLSYLEGMPAKDRALEIINSGITDPDPIIMAAKKVTSAKVLAYFIDIMAGGRTMVQKEYELQNEYKNMALQIKNEFTKSLTVARQRNLFKITCDRYDNSGKMDNFAFEHLVSPSTKQKLKEKTAEIETVAATPPTSNKSTIETIIFLIGGLSLIGAFWLKYSLNKYEFNNRTSGGVVQFQTYSQSMWHNSKHGIANLLYGVGILSIVIGSIVHFGTK